MGPSDNGRADPIEPPPPSVGTVLVTGGSGFIGAWTIFELLRRGYMVRTTVRNREREEEICVRHGSQTKTGQLTTVIADLLADEGWDQAVEGCTHILHLAAPVGVAAPRDPEALITPTRDGALRVIDFACRAGVERVVMTSAVDACRPPIDAPDGLYDEAYWTDADEGRWGPYRIAKTLAEQAAWNSMSGRSGDTSLTTILPAAVLGPALDQSQAHALRLTSRMLRGQMPGLPRAGFCVVDVRDVVDLHIRAMLAPAAAGQRFNAAGDWLWMSDMADLLRTQLGPIARRVPRRTLPNWAVRAAAFRDPSARFLIPLLGHKHLFSSAKAKKQLGWAARPVADTIAGTAESALILG